MLENFSYNQEPRMYSAWKASDGTVTFIDGWKQPFWLEDSGSVLLYSFKADDWESAVQRHYDTQGWGKYEPTGD